MLKELRTVLLFAMLMAGLRLSAQTSTTTDSLEFAFLPAISYNSDLGLIGGGIANRYLYKNNIQPFFAYTSTSLVLSTKGLASFEITQDKPGAFGSNLRVTSQLYIFRFLQDSYFGVQNYRKIDDSDPNDALYYTFRSFSIGFNSEVRIPISTSKIEGLASINLGYETPWGNGADRLIAIERPLGINGGRTFLLGTGFIREHRDSEFHPTKGNFIKNSFELGNTLWGSNYDMFVFESELRTYYTFHIIKDITLANRVYIKHTNGDIPYWKMAYAGDDETLRGVSSKRFRDDNSLIFNTELRTWFVSIPSLENQVWG